MHESVAILGAGPAGLGAAVELADRGVQTLLLERDLHVGGRAAEYTCKATSECARCNVCLVSDLAEQARSHPMIESHFGVQVRDLRGERGDFQLRAQRKGVAVDPALCTGCGLCTVQCPAGGESPLYLAGLPGDRTYRLERSRCEKDCRACEEACPVGAIDLAPADETLSFEFGHLIVATGFQPFPATTMAEYGYGTVPAVVTAEDLEDGLRTAGDPIDYLGDARRIAFVQCVGSRDETENGYCSSVCCAYTMRLSRLLQEKVSDLQLTVYYMDLQSFGRSWGQFRDRSADLGVKMLRGKPAAVRAGPGDTATVLREDPSDGGRRSAEHDLVVLSVGIAPAKDAGQMGQILQLTRDRDGFFTVGPGEAGATETNIPGISVAGTCAGPRDIEQSIAHGRQAALGVRSSLEKGRSS